MSNNKIVLAVDPGITTGICILRDDGGVLLSQDLHCSELDNFDTTLYGITDIVIERTPIPTLSPMNRELRKVIQFFEDQFPQADYVLPGQWKRVTEGIRLPWKNRVSQHRKDSFRLAKYYLTKGSKT